MEPRQWECLKAVIDRVVPRDAYPSASEAGVLTFFERLIPVEGLEETYRAGLDEIEAEACMRYVKSFAELGPDEQDELLRDIEGSDDPTGRFFRLLAEQTIEGYYADPGNGGNRDRVAWEMIGYRVTA